MTISGSPHDRGYSSLSQWVMDFISSLAATAAGSTSQPHPINYKEFGKENGKDNPARQFCRMIPAQFRPLPAPKKTITPALTRWGQKAPFRVSAEKFELGRSGRCNPTQAANYKPPVLIAEQKEFGAGEGNRTLLVGLGSRCITTMLRPPPQHASILANSPAKSSLE